jgi:putative endonuclease
MIQLPYSVYVLFSEKDRILYIGFSSDIEKRISKHNEGGVLSTRSRRPLKLIFIEYYLFKKDAMDRENYFKTTAGKRAIKLMLHETLRSIGYKGSMLEKDLAIIFE